jgi:hypothetical protein
MDDHQHCRSRPLWVRLLQLLETLVTLAAGLVTVARALGWL